MSKILAADYVGLVNGRITTKQIEIVSEICTILNSTLWSNNLVDALKNYTDHKLDHSYHVLKRVLELTDNAKKFGFKDLSENAVFAFTLAALLHDISMAGNLKRHGDEKIMQYFDKAQKDNVNYDDYPEIADNYTKVQQDEIRKYHAYFSIAKIRLSRAESSQRLYNVLNQIDDDLLEYVYTFIQFHCKEKISAIPDQTQGRKIPDIELPFSALLFRLADELDLGEERDIEAVRQEGMSEESKAYWEMDYRMSVTISAYNFVEIKFLANADDIAKHKSLFNKIVENHIKKNGELVNKLHKHNFIVRYSEVEDYTEPDGTKAFLSPEIIKQLKKIVGEKQNPVQEENDRITFLEKCVMDELKINKNYMGVIIPAIGDRYKLYVYKEFTLLERKESIKCEIRTDSKNRNYRKLTKDTLKLEVYLAYRDEQHKYTDFFKCDYDNVGEVSVGKEYLQFKVQLAQNTSRGKAFLPLKKGGKMAIFYTYEIYCAHYGNELVRKTSPFLEEDIQCEFIFPKKNKDYYKFTFYENVKSFEDVRSDLMHRIDEHQKYADKSILCSIHSSDEQFQKRVIAPLFAGYDHCLTVNYKNWILQEKKTKNAIWTFVACWNFVPFFTDPEMYLKAERYLNEGSPSKFTHKHIASEEYSPFSVNPEFAVNSFVLSDSNMEWKHYGESPKWLEKNELLVHPDFEEYFNAFAKKASFKVIPTASSRTVFIKEQQCYVKLQYNKLLGRLERLFTPEKIETAIEISKLLTEKCDKQVFSGGIYFLPEESGKIVKANNDEFGSPPNDNGYWGMLIRSYTPYPHVIKDECRRVIPAFSLFAKDEQGHFSRTLLELLFDFRADTKKNFKQFLIDKIIKPTYQLYFELLLKTGLHIEGHAQNILYLLEIKDNTLDIKGAVIRDFESFDKDAYIINRINPDSYFSELTVNVNNPNNPEQYAKRNSFLFDFKLGEYLITPLIDHAIAIRKKSMRKKWKHKIGEDLEKTMREEIRNFNANYIKELPADFFPKDKWFAYDTVEIIRTTTARPWVVGKGPPKYR
jgi:hypothetical protein